MSRSLFGLLAVLLSSAADVTFGYSILMCPIATRSHVYSAAVIATRLADRGHTVTVLLPEHFPGEVAAAELHNETGRVFIERFVEAGADDPLATVSQDQLIDSLTAQLMEQHGDSWAWMNIIKDIIESLCSKLTTKNEELFARLSKSKFDLAVIDGLVFVKCVYLIPHRLGIPWITYSDGADPLLVRVPWLPSFVPNIITTYSDRMSFAERLKNTFLTIMFTIFSPVPEPPTEVLDRYRKYGDFSSLNELMSRSLLWMLTSDNVLDYPRPSMPNMVNVGGLTIKRSTGKLPAEIQDFIGDGSRGVILVSFGSLVSSFPLSITEKFLTAFKQLKDYRIIWRMNNKNGVKLPENVVISQWLPQNDILAHPAVKLFITHCGNNGQFEAVYHGIPMIGFPLFGDQVHNAKRLDHKHYGMSMELYDFSAAELLKNVRTILADKSYKDSISKASEIYRSQPQSPVERATFWIEHICRFGGDHLHSAGNDLPLYQYLMLDVLAAVLVTFSIASLLLFNLARYLFRKCCSLSTQTIVRSSKIVRSPKKVN